MIQIIQNGIMTTSIIGMGCATVLMMVSGAYKMKKGGKSNDKTTKGITSKGND